MSFAVFLRTEATWFLFKVFDDIERAKQSQQGFRAMGFDCLLVCTSNYNHLLETQGLLS